MIACRQWTLADGAALAVMRSAARGPFQAKSPACYRVSWQMPGPAPYRQATTRVASTKVTVDYATVPPPIPLGGRSHPGTAVRDGTDAVRGVSGCEPGPIPIDGGHRRRQP